MERKNGLVDRVERMIFHCVSSALVIKRSYLPVRKHRGVLPV